MEVAGGGGGGNDGDGAAKRRKLSSGDSVADSGEDRLSALPDDILVLILLHLRTATAARTSVLSRRWRRVWALLPELRFLQAPEPHLLRDALDGHEAPVRDLVVGTDGAAPEYLATWLPAAARRVSGHLTLYNFGRERDAEEDGAAAQRGYFELPCFEQAISISLFLGFDGLAVPPAGVFARLTGLFLSRVRFHTPGQLGDAVSSPRCPCLQTLTVSDARGLGDLAIHSESLLQVELKKLRGLSQLTVVAPALKELTVILCFCNDRSQPIASILAPQLATLDWRDVYDPSSIQLEMTAHLRLGIFFYLVYGHGGSITHNHSCLRLLRRFEAMDTLFLTLGYLPDIEYYQYLMEDMTVLPHVTFLCLLACANGHAFGASSFHVLRLCTGIRRLMLVLSSSTGSEAQTVCPSGCICGQPAEWETEELSLNHLGEVEIRDFRGSEHEIAFVKRLFSWGKELKEMTVIFYYSVSEIEAKELYETLHCFSRPGICMKFYMYRDLCKVLYAPED